MFPVAANWISHSSHFCCLRKNQPKPINSKSERLFPMSYLIRILISKASWIRCFPSSLGTGQTVTINKNTLTRSQRCLWSNNYEFNVLIFAELSEGTVIADGDGCEQRRQTTSLQTFLKLLPSATKCSTLSRPFTGCRCFLPGQPEPKL